MTKRDAHVVVGTTITGAVLMSCFLILFGLYLPFIVPSESYIGSQCSVKNFTVINNNNTGQELYNVVLINVTFTTCSGETYKENTTHGSWPDLTEAKWWGEEMVQSNLTFPCWYLGSDPNNTLVVTNPQGARFGPKYGKHLLFPAIGIGVFNVIWNIWNIVMNLWSVRPIMLQYENPHTFYSPILT